LHLSKIRILFPVSLTIEYKVNADQWRCVGKYVHYNCKTAKIGCCTSLKLLSYFRFVSEAIA